MRIDSGRVILVATPDHGEQLAVVKFRLLKSAHPIGADFRVFCPGLGDCNLWVKHIVDPVPRCQICSNYDWYWRGEILFPEAIVCAVCWPPSITQKECEWQLTETVEQLITKDARFELFRCAIDDLKAEPWPEVQRKLLAWTVQLFVDTSDPEISQLIDDLIRKRDL